MNRKDYVELIWNGKEQAIKESELPTNKKFITCEEESKDFDTTQNLYIEGDNLDALKLLKKEYQNKIKMIYIDPPYNTGNKFIYSDNLSHADWLNMIYPRLKLARDLLTDDGVIFISIDDNEQANLKKVCDEIFGENNCLAALIWDLGTGTTAGHFTRGHEYILSYCREKSILSNFDNYNIGEKIVHGALKKISHKNPASEILFPTGFEYEGKNAVFSGELGNSEKEYILSEEMKFINGKLVKPTIVKAGYAMKKQIEDFIAGKPVKDSKGQKVLKFYFNKNGILFYEKEKTVINPRTVLSNIANTKQGTSELSKLIDGGEFNFSFPKPVDLLIYIIRLVASRDSLILDFFSGSATTAHAVMKLNAEDGGNRKFIMVQLPEVCAETSEAYKAGYKNICEIGKERIRRAGQKIKDESPLTTQNLDVGFRVLKIVDKD